MRCLLLGALTAAPYLCFDQVAQRLGDLLLPLVTAVQVDQRSAGRRVAHAIHQLPQRSPGARRKLVAGVAQIVEVKLAKPRNGVGRRVLRQ